MRHISSTSWLRSEVWPVSMRQTLVSDHSSFSAAVLTVMRCPARSSRRYLPSCRRGTVEPVVWSVIVSPSLAERSLADLRFESSFFFGSKCIISNGQIYMQVLSETLHPGPGKGHPDGRKWRRHSRPGI